MLKILRQKGVAKLIGWIIAVIIIISFGLFGTAYMLAGRSKSSNAGKIFNRNVSFNDFEKKYRQVESFLMLRFQDKYPQVRPYINLESETWDRLILLYEAKQKSIHITDQDIIDSIQNNPIFQREGSFDSMLYNDILRYVLRVKARDFEEGIRDTLTISKLLDTQTSSVVVTDEEILKEFKKQNEKIQVSYIIIPTEEFISSVTADEQEALNYFNENKEEFKEPPSVTTEFIDIPFADNAKEADKTATRQRADSISSQLSNNTNISEVAKTNNLTVQSSGPISVGQPSPWSLDILSAVFQLKPNEITLPMETPKGYVIIKLLQRQDGFIPEFEAIKEKIFTAVKRGKAKNLAKIKAQEARVKILEEMNKTKLVDFAAAAKTLGYEIAQTPMFNRGQYLPKIGPSPEFQETAFKLIEEKDWVSQPVDIEQGVTLLHKDGVEEADQALLEKQKDTIKGQIFNERKNQIANEFLAQVRLQANLEDNISKMKKN